MKRSLESPKPRQSGTIGWVQFIGMVLAFVTLWQVLARGVAWVDRWF